MFLMSSVVDVCVTVSPTNTEKQELDYKSDRFPLFLIQNFTQGKSFVKIYKS